MHILALEGDIDLFQYVLKSQIDEHLKDVLKPKFGFQILDKTNFDKDDDRVMIPKQSLQDLLFT
jgi:hypothetical protein